MYARTRGILALAVLTSGLIFVPVVHLANERRPISLNRLVPTATLSPADTAVAEQLRKLLDFNFTRLIGGWRDRADVATFYRTRGFAPLWIKNGIASTQRLAAVEYLATVDNEGLEPSDYVAATISADANVAALAESELSLTAIILKYARAAQNGRIIFSRVSADVDYQRKIAKARDVLGKVAQADDLASALASFNPPQQGYKALRVKLAELRKRKLNLNNEIAGSDIPTSGPSKMSANLISTFDRIDVVLANMERWRWMPRELGIDYVMVNIPDYKLTLVHNALLYFRTNVVVGSPDLPTPLLSAMMNSITINPIWHIPKSLVENEYLPMLERDPGLVARMGLTVETNATGDVRIYQLPGDLNVLGRIRFNFPNRFHVYQHDTDDKRLFGLDQRDSSHGCMRVENPFSYAAALLSLVSPSDGYTEQRLRDKISDREVLINFPAPIPVHLTYQTAFVDDFGDLVVREDLYGLDARLIAALNRRDAASRVARKTQ